MREAEAVLTMLADPAALVAVSENPDGFAGALSPGATVVEMSTVGPSAVRRLAGALPEGVGLLDAPVLGSLPQAEAGELRVFAGGPDELVARFRALLATFGAVVHVGPLGSGAATKLVVNSTLGGVLAVLGEALALADGLGLDQAVALDALEESPLGAQVRRRRAALESQEIPLHFRLALAVKNLDLVAGAAEEDGVDLRVAPAARSWFADAARDEQDYAAVLSYVRRRRAAAGA